MIKLLSIRANNFKLLDSLDLRFPDRGSILIEGRNEAGKSTLFEAVFFALFGRPLVPGSNTQDLIAYQATEAIVELEVSVRGCRLAVQRRVRRTKAGASTDARLRVFDEAGAAVEEVKGAVAVNGRLQQEMKLDADAFLNSCFVEQKKLEKLEGMSARDRGESMRKLLNLERMDAEIDALRLTPEDQRAAARARQRVRLAEVIDEIPLVQKRGREVQRAIQVADLKAELTALEESQRIRDEAAARVAALEEPIRLLGERIARAEALHAAAGAAQLAGAHLGKVESYRGQAADIEAQLSELDALECEGLPALRQRRRRLAALRSLHTRLLALSAEAEESAVDAEGIAARLDAREASGAVMAEARLRLAELAGPIAALEDQIARIDALHATVASAELAMARLGAVDQNRAEIARLREQAAAIDRDEAETLPALVARRRSLGVLASQWRRLGALAEEVARVEAEAQEARRRLAAIEAARVETAAEETRLAGEEARLAALEAEADGLAGGERAASLRVALEDWQAAYRAKGALYTLETELGRAEEGSAAAEAESARAKAEAGRWRKAAGSAARGAGAAGAGAVIFGLAAALLHMLALGLVAAVPMLYALARAAAWRAASARAASAASALAGADERLRDAQRSVLLLQGQRDQAQATEGASASRLEVAAARFEALEEPVPLSLDQAARRLRDLPEPAGSPDALRDRLAALRQEIAAGRAAHAEQARALQARLRGLDAGSESPLRTAATRLEERAARITELIIDRWAEAARSRSDRLGVPALDAPTASATAVDRAIAQTEADARVARDRVAARPALADRIARLEAGVEDAVREANEGRDAILATRADAAAWRDEAAAGIEALDEPSVRDELGRLIADRAAAETDRATAAGESRRIETELAARFQAPADWAVAESVVQAGLARLRARAERISAVVALWSERAEDRAQGLGLPESGDLEQARQAATRAEAAAAADVRVAEQRLAGRAGLQERILRLNEAIAEARSRVEAARPPILLVRPEAPALDTRADVERLLADLHAEMESLDEPGARRELGERQDERSAAENTRYAAERDEQRHGAGLRERATRLEYPEDAPLTREALERDLPAWPEGDPADREQLEAEFTTLRERMGYLRETRTDLAAALGLDPGKERLNLEREQELLSALVHDHRVRETAARIITAARDRIVLKVLPYTIEHMRRILPAITSDRYHDARLTDDYKIEVWDERASMWKKKDIFSGGTRDQFSLALRLAFAMATLPQERGAAPGFIFLDEPLSSFDVERSDALMYLLTQGEVASTFDQILVISHSQTVAAGSFGHRLRLDMGRVAEVSDDMRTAEAGQLEMAVE